jgi:DNA replication licensing factor MCM3
MGTSRRSKKNKMEVLSLTFVKKYIQYAKARPAPVLTKGAADWIVNVYSGLRNDEVDANNRRVGLSTAGSALSVFFLVETDHELRQHR